MLAMYGDWYDLVQPGKWARGHYLFRA
jgi:hypothetical protein